MPDKPYLEEQYKLSQNPFASRTDPTVDMAGRVREKGEWTEAIERRRGKRANAIHFIVGDYGFGKTLALHKIVEQYQQDDQILVVSMKMLPEDRVSNFGVDFIHRIFRAVPNELFTKFDSDEIQKLDEVLPEPRKILTKASFSDDAALLFLRGDIPMSAAQLSKLGVQRRINRTEIAKEYLVAFLILLKGLGIDTLLLTIDEVEYVFSQMRGANIARVFNTLRDFYDLLDSALVRQLPSQPANMVFFLAISTAGWSRLNDLEQREQAEGGPLQPLRRRFGEIIELDPLSKSETRDLIELRLRRNRITGEVADEPLIPYTEDFVSYVHEHSLGNPGEVVRLSDHVLEEGLSRKISTLDREFAKLALVEHGLVPQSD